MTKLVDGTPTKLAERSESCPCHEVLYGFYSTHMRGVMFQKHYDETWSSCPYAGCHAPDMAAGWLNDMLDTLWAAMESKLFTPRIGGQNIVLDPETSIEQKLP